MQYFLKGGGGSGQGKGKKKTHKAPQDSGAEPHENTVKERASEKPGRKDTGVGLNAPVASLVMEAGEQYPSQGEENKNYKRGENCQDNDN
jgi:hypothetical protein